MLIAFEGPDKTGKSTSANRLDSLAHAQYNLTKAVYNDAVSGDHNLPGTVQAFDRIDWLTHMVYRLAMPGHDWNDDRPRTVFAAPDMHLVFKLHRRELAGQIDDELYQTGALTTVNDMYRDVAEGLMQINEKRDFALFKTITVVEVQNPPGTDTFHQQVVDFSSPVHPWGTVASKIANTDEALLRMLVYEDQHRL